jgi:peroxiredoxin (alkyl hydroperoxide reductase subunit C)
MTMLGQQAPAFELPSTKNIASLEEPVRLTDHAGRWLVLFFYPADFTFVCPTEMIAFNAAIPRFADLGADFVGISTDTVHAHLAWQEFHIGMLDFPLAADTTHEVSRAFGVLDEVNGVAHRGVFIIDPEGLIRYEVVHDEPVGRSVDEVLRVLAALQSKGRTPANWSPEMVTGAPTAPAAH